jgi:hypothetical protein
MTPGAGRVLGKISAVTVTPDADADADAGADGHADRAGADLGRPATAGDWCNLGAVHDVRRRRHSDLRWPHVPMHPSAYVPARLGARERGGAVERGVNQARSDPSRS